MIYDYIIVGGGMVGASLACALENKSIALIDATSLPFEDPRLIALNYGSVNFFENLNVFSDLKNVATPIQQLHVSQQGRFGSARIHANELDLPFLGYLTPAKWINHFLEKKCSEKNNISVHRPARLKTLSQENNIITITLEKNNQIETLQAHRLVGADGTHSTVRELLQIPTEIMDYEQSAIVSIIQLQRHHDYVAYERFTQRGAVAMLPMTDNQVAMIWTEDNIFIKELLSLSDADFLTQLQKAFGYRLGKLISVGKRYTFPLKSFSAKETVKENVMLIGNAAHTVHPIAAQGLNLALYEVADFVGSDYKLISNPKNLSHRLHTLFSTDFFPLNQARKFAMIGLDISLSAKQFFMKKAMKRSGRIPTLLQDNYGSQTSTDKSGIN